LLPFFKPLSIGSQIQLGKSASIAADPIIPTASSTEQCLCTYIRPSGSTFRKVRLPCISMTANPAAPLRVHRYTRYPTAGGRPSVVNPARIRTPVTNSNQLQDRTRMNVLHNLHPWRTLLRISCLNNSTQSIQFGLFCSWLQSSQESAGSHSYASHMFGNRLYKMFRCLRQSTADRFVPP